MRPAILDPLFAPVTTLSGIGPQLAKLFERLAGPPQAWKEKHLKLAVKHGARSMVLKAFGMGERAAELSAGLDFDMAFEIERDWQYGGLGLIARDWRAQKA